MKNNIVYGSIFLVITIIGMTIIYMLYQNNYVNFDTSKIEIVLDNESWTNKNITVTAKYNGNIKVKSYSFDGGVTWQSENTYTAATNQKIEIVLKGSFDRKSTKVQYRVANIDKELPTIDVEDIIYTAKGREFNLEDYYEISDTISGIREINITNDDLVDINTIGEYEVDIQATDNAGNISTKTVTVAVVSKKDPNLTENQKGKISVTGITLDRTKVSLVKGTSLKITPTIKPSNATNKKVRWSSVNTSVAKVSSNGEITAIGAGSTTVTATTVDGEKVSEISVIVTDKAIEVDSIILDRKTDTVTTDSNVIVLTATVKPENATNSDLTWSSSKLSVATVKDGKVTIKGEGETTISAVSSNGKIATYHLIVRDNYVFQEIEIYKRKELVGYQIKIYKNGVDITEDITAITSPISVTHNRKKQLEITFKQHEELKDTITIMYESTKRNVKRG